MKEIKIKTDFIKLGQFLKYIGCILNGAEAKQYLNEYAVLVNGSLEQRRGRKLIVGDIIKINEIEYKVI